MEIPTILELVNLTLALSEDYDRPRGGTDSGWGFVVLLILGGLFLSWFLNDDNFRKFGGSGSVRRPSSKKKMPWYVNQKQDED